MVSKMPTECWRPASCRDMVAESESMNFPSMYIFMIDMVGGCEGLVNCCVEGFEDSLCFVDGFDVFLVGVGIGDYSATY